MGCKRNLLYFVNCSNEKYKRLNLQCEPFMSVLTFIDWFFAWASGMKIECRETCKWCDGNQSVLACDGTKVGINFKNTFVAPGNTHEITSPSRRYNRCSYQIQAIMTRFAVFMPKLEII